MSGGTIRRPCGAGCMPPPQQTLPSRQRRANWHGSGARTSNYAWSATSYKKWLTPSRTCPTEPALSVYRRTRAGVPHQHVVSHARSSPQRLLCLETSSDQCPHPAGSADDGPDSDHLSGQSSDLWQPTGAGRVTGPGGTAHTHTRGLADAAGPVGGATTAAARANDHQPARVVGGPEPCGAALYC
ncbi:MAG: hypothetical protein GFH27_549285n372 [Chloroflexi bacterium AL-W]|nr:hypothetical protein [Chloroflexi bacterium AL-N1]NOK65883.1 hypothetical protein [Chloroflexi bacterium AL-N10]NOK74176.1 hypothetical protein [Chloroflexi bacterium AL-N5]NOK80916.1 hypothetical protein [Chloroflexi bacterium AL-W]NOK88434.1 hypothetical protein [Chloroflexi bacterium AL-N15]